MDLIRDEQNNTISLCLIVKNEQENLEKSISSVISFVDELIIVDTGSKDQTLAIAEKFAAKIFHYDWDEDFSGARNFSLEKASCDWILVLDADEEITNPEKIRDAIQFENGLVNFIYVQENFNEDVCLQNLQPRLFRNRPDIRYKNNVYESIVASLFKIEIEERKLARDFPLYIRHFGVENRENAIDKIARNTQLVEKKLTDINISPEERITFILKLINNYRFLNSEATKVVSLIMHVYELMTKKHYREIKYDPQSLTFNIYLIDHLIMIKKFDSAKDLIDKALEFYPLSLNLNFMSFQLELESGKKEFAIKKLVACKYLLENDIYFKYEPILIKTISVSITNFSQTFLSQGIDLVKLEKDFAEDLKKKKLLI